MPYLYELPTYKCCKCGRNAKVELRNDRGGSIGYFCNPCGKRHLKIAQEETDKRAVITATMNS